MEPDNHFGDDDSFDRLAEDLMCMRRRHGEKSLAAFEKRTQISTTTYSDTLNGKVRPSARTIRGLAICCGEDPEPFLQRREKLLERERLMRPVPGTDVIDPVVLPPRSSGTPANAVPEVAQVVVDLAPTEPERRKRTFGLGALIGVAAGAAVVGCAATSIAWAVIDSSDSELHAAGSGSVQVAATSSMVPYGNGVDPQKTECREDKKLAASETRGSGKSKNKFQVQYFYSPKCMAVWGQVTRYDNKSATDWLAVEVYAQGEPDSPTAQSKKADGVQTTYSPMRIEPDKSLPNCVQARASVDGKEVDLGPALCA